MTCFPLRSSTGQHVGFICGVRQLRCMADGCRAYRKLECDGPTDKIVKKTGKRKTCDRALCLEHAVEIGPELHLCPACVDLTRERFSSLAKQLRTQGEPAAVGSWPAEARRWPPYEMPRPRVLWLTADFVWLVDVTFQTAWQMARAPLEDQLVMLAGIEAPDARK